MNKVTEDNLKHTLANESEAQIKYEQYAAQADKEGFGNVARLFRAASYSEQVHAALALKAVRGVSGTANNLSRALENELFEVQQIYPAYLAVAKMQGEEEAGRVLDWVLESEKGQVNMYQDAKSAVDGGLDMELLGVFVCPVCGYTAKDQPPEKCPLSGTPGFEFRGF